MGRTVNELLKGRDNNFTLIRFLAATAVIYSHCFVVLYRESGAPELGFGFTTNDFGIYAVDVFFIVSGFLVGKSLLTRPDIVDYLVSRTLRLVPALLAACLALAFLIGPLVTGFSLKLYFSDMRTWLYAPATASLLSHSRGLPGVFEGVPMSGLMNVPLWTLPYEVLCYLALALFAALGMFSTRWRGVASLLVFYALYGFITYDTDWRQSTSHTDNILRFGLCFSLGLFFYLMRDRIRLSWMALLGLSLTAIAARHTLVAEAASHIVIAYAIFCVAFTPFELGRRFEMIGDPSYGLYIFSWPLQQIAALVDPTVTPNLMFSEVFPIALMLALISWHWLERPCLSLRTVVHDSLAKSLSRTAAASAMARSLLRPATTEALAAAPRRMEQSHA